MVPHIGVEVVTFIPPMMAAPYPKDGLDPSKGGPWIAEEKFDGIRLIIEVDRDTPADLLCPYTVRAWTRYANAFILPRHLQEDIGRLPTGVYDTETYVPGKRSFGAKTIAEAGNLRVAIFDILELMGESTTGFTLEHRRGFLSEIFSREHCRSESVSFAPARILETYDQMVDFRNEVWDRDGEGLIVKDLSAIYQPGKRPKNVWIKIKQLRSAVLTVIGFQPSKGEIIDRGPYATVVLQDDDGISTTVKTRNDIELARFEREAPTVGTHPAIGRRLRIKYQERTPDNGYRHPRWDRWEED
jgi:ATP-dependent DNA ligase